MSTQSSKFLISFSSLLLIHSCYSANEFSKIPTTTTSIPLDITLETLLGASLLCVGIILGGWELKPIAWRVWSGQLEREKGSGSYGYLEERLGFLDIRAKRAEFVKWAKEGVDVKEST